MSVVYMVDYFSGYASQIASAEENRNFKIMDAKADAQNDDAPNSTYDDCKLSSAIEVNPAVAGYAPGVDKTAFHKPDSSEAYFKHMNFVYMSKIVDGKMNPDFITTFKL